jgi:tetratricopeptide (TPR) repeat protein
MANNTSNGLNAFHYQKEKIQPGLTQVKIINRIKKIFWSGASSENKSLITRRFIIAVSVIYSVLILAASASFHYSMDTSARILSDALFSHDREAITYKIDTLIERLRDKKAKSKEDIQKEIENYNAAMGDILYAIIFSKTEDENYYRIIHLIQLRNDFDLKLPRNGVVKENKKINYLKKGLLNSTMDPDIYSQDNYHWHTIYYPYEMKGKKIVLQFLVSASKTEESVRNFSDSLRRIRLMNIIVTVVLAIAVTMLTIVFAQNYSLLIRNLSRYMKKAANGDHDVSLNPTADGELTQLAQSFNTLMEELKDKTDRHAPVADGIDDLFGTGVKALKENRLEEAIAIFKTMTIVKPQGFSSHFNLGVAYAKKRDYGSALAAFEQALQLNPSHDLTKTYIQKVQGLNKPDA